MKKHIVAGWLLLCGPVGAAHAESTDPFRACKSNYTTTSFLGITTGTVCTLTKTMCDGSVITYTFPEVSYSDCTGTLGAQYCPTAYGKQPMYPCEDVAQPVYLEIIIPSQKEDDVLL
jgi:hypothetical protein